MFESRTREFEPHDSLFSVNLDENFNNMKKKNKLRNSPKNTIYYHDSIFLNFRIRTLNFFDNFSKFYKSFKSST